MIAGVYAETFHPCAIAENTDNDGELDQHAGAYIANRSLRDTRRRVYVSENLLLLTRLGGVRRPRLGGFVGNYLLTRIASLAIAVLPTILAHELGA